MLWIDSGLPLGLQGAAAPYRSSHPRGGQPTNRLAPSRRGDCFCCDVVTGELVDGGRPSKAAFLDVKIPRQQAACVSHLPEQHALSDQCQWLLQSLQSLQSRDASPSKLLVTSPWRRAADAHAGCQRDGPGRLGDLVARRKSKITEHAQSGRAGPWRTGRGLRGPQSGLIDGWTNGQVEMDEVMGSIQPSMLVWGADGGGWWVGGGWLLPLLSGRRRAASHFETAGRDCSPQIAAWPPSVLHLLHPASTALASRLLCRGGCCRGWGVVNSTVEVGLFPPHSAPLARAVLETAAGANQAMLPRKPLLGSLPGPGPCLRT